MKYFSLIALFLTVTLTACGGGGSSSGSLPASRPAGTVTGVAFDAAVSNGTVSVYDFSSGAKGALLGSGQTSADGQFAIDIVAPDKPVLIEVVGGSYLEEASGLQVQIDPAQKLSAVQMFRSGQSVTAHVTFFTTLVAGLAEYWVQAEGRAAADAIRAANQQISEWAGFDVMMTSPLNVTDPTNRASVLTDALRAGLAAAGISEMTRQVSVDAGQPEHSTWNSIAFIQAAYEDIRADGVLDGNGDSGAINLGTTTLTGDTYRTTLAERVLQFVNGDKNVTGLGFNDVLPFGTVLGSNAGATFGGAPAVDFTAAKPTVTQFIPKDGSTVSGSASTSALLGDSLGIASVEWFVDGRRVTAASGGISASQTIDTLNFPDGQHVVSIQVTNSLGNTTVVENTVIFANSSPVVGTAFDGLIIGGDVSIYDFTGASKGVLLGSGTTDDKGLYSVSIISSDRPILIEIDGGFYIEETTGIEIQVDRALGYKLTAVQLYRSGVPVTMNATFFTTVATGLVEYQVSNQGAAIANAILNANQQMSSWAGFDIETTVPEDVSDPANTSPFLTNELSYGFVAAGISELTRQVNIDAGEPAHSRWPSIAFIQAAYDDVRTDGLLDGRGPSGAVTLGNLTLTPDVYRATLSERLMQFVVSAQNNTTLGFDTVLPFADTLNAFAGSLFSNQSGVDFKTTVKPTVTQLLPADGDTISNTSSYPLSVIANDIFGVASVEYLVDGSVVATAANPRAPTERISTFDYSNGPHKLSVRVTNLLGNTTVVDNTVTIANGAVSITPPAGGGGNFEAKTCTYNLQINDGAGIGISSVTQDGLLIASDLPGTSTLQVTVRALSSSNTNSKIVVTDNLGNTAAITFTTFLDDDPDSLTNGRVFCTVVGQ